MWKQTPDYELRKRISFRHDLETSFTFRVSHNRGVDMISPMPWVQDSFS